MADCARLDRSLAVVYIDIDDLKDVNDELGYAMGDQLLASIALALGSCLDEGDTIARFGGDEFVVLVSGLGTDGNYASVVQRLLAAAGTPAKMVDPLINISVSVGVSIYPQDDSDSKQLIRHAIHAMHAAKQNGKNQISFYDAAEGAAIRALASLVEEIRHGLDCDEFVLFYQPKVNMRTGEVIGAEALLRWQHPERGLLLPGMFLPHVENHAVSIPLGEWVLARALRQMQCWQQQGIFLPVSVNVGAMQLELPEFLHRLGLLLQEVPLLRPEMLSLEILETTALLDIPRVRGLIEESSLTGVSFALDDFCTGYSSLSYLRSLPVQLVKIDRSFVQDIVSSADARAIVKSVIELAKAFGRQVIAEGVELPQHAESLLEIGCELGQGYCIARPMPADLVPGCRAGHCRITGSRTRSGK